MAILVLLCVYCCKHKVHNFVEVLDELYVRYFVSDADQIRNGLEKEVVDIQSLPCFYANQFNTFLNTNSVILLWHC